MRKSELIFVVTILTISLLGVSAQMPPDGRPDHHNGKGMANMGPHDPKYYNRGFQTPSEFMIITGLIDVNEEGIVLSISVSPNITSMEDMAQRHMEDGSRMYEMMGNDFPSNTVNITLYQLVEFEDQGTQGYTDDDIIISSYDLTSNTLGDLVYSTDGKSQNYTLSSNDGVFSMNVVATSNDVQSFKWSVEIKYPFLSNSSKIAMLHDVTTENSMMNMGRGKMHHPSTEEVPVHYKNTSIIIEDEDVPMFFDWLDTANVDGEEQNVDATSSTGYFALSIAQGSKIYYDPSIGVENSVIQQLDLSISNILNQEQINSFAENVFSPTVGTIAITGIIIAGILLYINRKKYF